MSEALVLRAERLAAQQENEDEPLSAEREAEYAGIEAADVRADQEFIRHPFVPFHLRRHVEAPWRNEEHDPSLPSEAERYFHPESQW